MKLKTLPSIDSFKDKTVLVRVDFNVPVDSGGSIKNDKRIRFAIPTIEFLLNSGAKKVILATHVGRPKENEEKLKTDKIAERLSELIGQKVAKVDDWGEGGLPESKIVLLENLRFHPGEKSKDASEKEAFAKQLAGLADIYVNEAFSNSHRDHASMIVSKFIPGVAGLGVEKEIEVIGGALESPEHPVVAVIAGAKADKLSAIDNLLKTADKVLIGGALAFALKAAQGVQVGKTKVDAEGMEAMKEVVEAIAQSDKVLLPTDAVVADDFAESANFKTVPVDAIEPEFMALDIGPETAKAYAAEIGQAKTVLWFGPLGVFEWPAAAEGTKTVGQAIANCSGLTIVGGGDSATAVEKFNLQDAMTHVSTGGGASLQMIEGKELPAIKLLEA